MSEHNPWISAAPRAGEDGSASETPEAPARDAVRTRPVAGPPAHRAEEKVPDTDQPPAAPHVPPPVTGASAPQSSVAPPAPGTGGLPVRMVRPTASLWVVGAHGGSGEGSIAGLHDSWEATDHAWPTPSDLSLRCPSILVARTHAPGLRAAQKALTQWASGVLGPSTALLGLVLVADAPGRLPKPLRELAAHVAGGAPRTWNVGWVEAWRLGEQLDETDLPKPLRQLTADLTALSGPTGTE